MFVRLSAGLLAAASLASQGTPRPVSLIVSNGVVVTMDSARRVLAPGAVAVDGGEIAAVGSPDEIARSYRATQSIDADGDVVMPGLIVPAVAPHAMYTLDRATLEAARNLADRERVPLIIHLAETRDELAIAREKHNATPVQYLESFGFFRARTLAAHGVHLTAADIATLKKRDVGVSHNPESNMKLASGTAPVLSLRSALVPVGLGTDGAASNNDLDMFEAMRQAGFLHKLQSNDPRALPAADVIAMATREGARALGMEAAIGSLEAGKRADLIVVSMKSPRQTPMYDPLSHLVYATRVTMCGRQS